MRSGQQRHALVAVLLSEPFDVWAAGPLRVESGRANLWRNLNDVKSTTCTASRIQTGAFSAKSNRR
jgi:hypothetical protein